MYITLLLGCGRLRTQVRNTPGDEIGRLARVIRCPPGERSLSKITIPYSTVTDSPAGYLVRKAVIPAVAHLRQLYPLRLNMVFPTPMLDLLNADGSVDCTDIGQSDAVFNTFIYQCVSLNLLTSACTLIPTQ